MGLCDNLNTGVSYNCDEKPVGGIEQRVWLFNIEDVDRTASVVNRDSTGNIHNISNFSLVTGANLYAFEGIDSLSVLYSGYTSEATDYGLYMIHMVNIAIYNQCEESMVLLNKFLNGARVGAIVENKGKGADNECAYSILGYERGMTSQEIAYNSNENNGVVPLVLQSTSTSLERYTPYVYLETDYATTTTKIDSLV